MGFAATWLRQVTPPPASQNHFNHCVWSTVRQAARGQTVIRYHVWWVDNKLVDVVVTEVDHYKKRCNSNVRKKTIFPTESLMRGILCHLLLISVSCIVLSAV